MKRYLGWEPKRTTRVTARDDQGRPTEWVTEIEPEFDVLEREGWEDLAEYEAGICQHCGNLRAICSDPDGIDGLGFYPQQDHCWVSAARDRADRIFRKRTEDAKPDLAGYLPGDGASIWASPFDLTPDDDFLLEGLPESDPPPDD